MPLVFTLAVLLTSRRIGDRSYSAESEPLNFGSEPGSEIFCTKQKIAAACFPQSRSAGCPESEKGFRKHMGSAASELVFKDIIQPGM